MNDLVHHCPHLVATLSQSTMFWWLIASHAAVTSGPHWRQENSPPWLHCYARSRLLSQNWDFAPWRSRNLYLKIGSFPEYRQFLRLLAKRMIQESRRWPQRSSCCESLVEKSLCKVLSEVVILNGCHSSHRKRNWSSSWFDVECCFVTFDCLLFLAKLLSTSLQSLLSWLHHQSPQPLGLCLTWTLLHVRIWYECFKRHQKFSRLIYVLYIQCFCSTNKYVPFKWLNSLKLYCH